MGPNLSRKTIEAGDNTSLNNYGRRKIPKALANVIASRFMTFNALVGSIRRRSSMLGLYPGKQKYLTAMLPRYYAPKVSVKRTNWVHSDRGFE
jgi:hypothetical protein